jgi:hypothetical protein
MNHRREAIDVNLLRVLYAVLTERSVTRAAGKLGQSQPAISLTVSYILRATASMNGASVA